MSVACIIEPEAQTLAIITSTIKEIDGRIDVLSFSDLDGFYKWFSQAIQQSKAINQNSVESSEIKKVNQKVEANPAIDLKLLMGDVKFLGPSYFSLIEKLKKLMIRRGIIKNEDDLAVILTTFDTPDLNIKQIESRIITNIFFKPFDIPILKQQLKVALGGAKSVSDTSVFQQNLESTAEMLKEVQLESFTDLGFTTNSNRNLKINDISKYYSQHFEIGNKSNVLARCVSCTPHPNIDGEFHAEFRYVGITNQQIKKLRQEQFTAQHSIDKIYNVSKSTINKSKTKNAADEASRSHFIIFYKSGSDPCLELKEALEKNISNISIIINRNLNQFLENLEKGDLSLLGEYPISGIFINVESVASAQAISQWNRILSIIESFNTNKSTNQKVLKENSGPQHSKIKEVTHQTPMRPKLIFVSQSELSESRIRSLGEIMTDVIYTPIDRPYLYKRMVTLCPDILPKQEDIDVLSVGTKEIIRVANPIEITSISEALITMKYYRPISFHAFRRFCLPSKNSTETVEMLGSCFYTEKKGNLYINHFVFFGISDKYLKYIRKWIMERYISSKDQNKSA